jgi:hypothetical protein
MQSIHALTKPLQHGGRAYFNLSAAILSKTGQNCHCSISHQIQPESIRDETISSCRKQQRLGLIFRKIRITTEAMMETRRRAEDRQVRIIHASTTAPKAIKYGGGGDALWEIITDNQFVDTAFRQQRLRAWQ